MEPSFVSEMPPATRSTPPRQVMNKPRVPAYLASFPVARFWESIDLAWTTVDAGVAVSRVLKRLPPLPQHVERLRAKLPPFAETLSTQLKSCSNDELLAWDYHFTTITDQVLDVLNLGSLYDDWRIAAFAVLAGQNFVNCLVELRIDPELLYPPCPVCTPRRCPPPPLDSPKCAYCNALSPFFGVGFKERRRRDVKARRGGKVLRDVADGSHPTAHA